MSTEVGTGQSLPHVLYKLRLIGHTLALISVGSVLYELRVHPLLMVGLIAFCLGFPHLAFCYARRAKQVRPAEFNSFCVSAVMWGFWIAVMQFNIIPSVLMVSGLHTAGAGGWKLYWKSLALLAGGILIGILVLGFEFHVETSLTTMIASIPAMIIFPLILGITNYNLSRSLVRQHRSALEMSRTDGLSGLMNRDYFDISAQIEFLRCLRGGHKSSFVMIDIDHFKQMNDSHGHLAGDKVIQYISKLFAQEVREIDFVARYGGEEFCLCLVDTDVKAASIVAERIRAKVETTTHVDSETKCTISCGVAEYSDHYRDYQQWLNKADKALYQAKRLGRNRVEVAEPPAILRQRNAGIPS